MGQPLSRSTRDRIRAAAAFLALGLGLLVILNFEGVLLMGAILFSERRPTLLQDAGWRDPSSAVRFEQRFSTGVAEEELLTWLQKNRFSIDRRMRIAERHMSSLPCNEDIKISWQSDHRSRLTEASAMVTEAGCL